MTRKPNLAIQLSSILIGVTMILSAAQPVKVAASTPSLANGIRRGYHARTGKLTFLGADASNPILNARAMERGLSPEGRALTNLAVYAGEFGIRDAGRELSVLRSSAANGRQVVRYQQVYNGIPVMAGELNVNMREDGSLLSINGELSPELDIDTQAGIPAEAAQLAALTAIGSAYNLDVSQLSVSEPQLWIYDERLMQEDAAQPAHLVWRMEVTSGEAPLRELVLINAQTGQISLHFNQVDTAWRGETISKSEEPQPAPLPVVHQPSGVVDPSLDRFVAATGTNSSDCTDYTAPCETINYAIGVAVSGDTIGVAAETYTGTGEEVVLLNKSVNLSGGWNSGFDTQIGRSILDGQDARKVVTAPSAEITASLDRFEIIRGKGIGLDTKAILSISNSIIAYNTAQWSGGPGGIYVKGGPLTITNTSIHGNEGSGMYLYTNLQLTINNTTISNNTSYGIKADFYGNTRINNSTITDNRAGGIFEDPTAASSIITELQNTILAGNNRLGTRRDCAGSLTSLGYNIIENVGSCSITATTGDQFNVNPQLSTFLTPLGYHSMWSTSPARNHGNPATCMTTDQRLAERTLCDIGAYEYIEAGTPAAMYNMDEDNRRLGPGKEIDSLRLVIVDAAGTPVPGVEVTFTAPASGSTGIFSTTGNNTATATTDQDGISTAPTFTVNDQVGTFLIQATSLAGTIEYSVDIEIWYISPAGSDANDCRTPTTPCATISGMIQHDDYIKSSVVWVTSDTYDMWDVHPGPYLSTDFLGGWDSTFTAQNGMTTLYMVVWLGSGIFGEMSFLFDHFEIAPKPGVYGARPVIILNETNLTLLNSTIRDGINGIKCDLSTLTIENSTIRDNLDDGIDASYCTLTVNHSIISGNGIPGSRFGSGLDVYQSVVRIDNSTISGNYSDHGGGIYNLGSPDMIINNSVIEDNIATISGGGVHGYSLIIRHSVIQNNAALSPDPEVEPVGGGVFGSIITIEDSQILNNQALRGGGIYTSHAYGEPPFTILRSIIRSNAARDGGGLNLEGPVTITDSSILDNTATGKGGGLYTAKSKLTLTNLTISGNTANKGGAMYQAKYGGPLTWPVRMFNVTISKNQGTVSGGIVNETGGGPITLANTILLGNTGSQVDCFGVLKSGGSNIIGSIGSATSPSCIIDTNQQDITGTNTRRILPAAVLVTTPVEDPLTGQWYYALRPGSLAIDAGSSAPPGTGLNSCPAADQLGIPRPQGVYCDIGAVEYQFATHPPSPLLKTYDAGHQKSLPGTLICSGSDATCDSSDAHISLAHAYTFNTYSSYLAWHARDSLDGNGMQILSSVRYGVDYPDAFWNGSMMVYGDAFGLPLADDIVAHELTHAVTSFTSNLFPWNQSGAINESFSDLWGEAVDQANGLGNDTDAVKWLIGEDVMGSSPLRSMSNPRAYNDPDSMTSSYYCKTGPCMDDRGGVHTNSGVNNKAAYLMVHGGTFNTYTITALGWAKVLTIYYEAQTNLLTSGSDYYDLYNALFQACQNKLGSNGILPEDCKQVRKATLAVRMNLQPAANFNPHAAYCPTFTDQVIPPLYQEDFEGGRNGWNFVGAGGKIAWNLSPENAASGKVSLWGDDGYEGVDSYARMPAIYVPVNSKPFLHFSHAYRFQTSGTKYFDGGILEYTTNTTLTWKDAKPLFSAGKNYSGMLEISSVNPLSGKSAFAGDSHGYVQSRYDLTSLAGEQVAFRWRLGTDKAGSMTGWYVDDIRFYVCVAKPGVPVLASPANNALLTDFTPKFDWSNSTPDLDHYDLQLATDPDFANILATYSPIPLSVYTPTTNLPGGASYYWRVRAVNAAGKSKGWSASRTFRTVYAGPLNGAPNGIITPDLLPAFTWDGVTGATSYRIQLSTSNTFSTIVLDKQATTNSFTPETPLEADTTYFWRVKVYGGVYAPGLWSSKWTFTTP